MTENDDVKISPRGIWEGLKSMVGIIIFFMSITATVCFWLSSISSKFDGVNDRLKDIQTKQRLQLLHSCLEESEQRDFDKGSMKWQNWAANQIKSTGQSPPESPDVPDNADFCRSVIDKSHDEQNQNSKGHSLYQQPQIDADAAAPRIYNPLTGR